MGSTFQHLDRSERTFISHHRLAPVRHVHRRVHCRVHHSSCASSVVAFIVRLLLRRWFNLIPSHVRIRMSTARCATPSATKSSFRTCLAIASRGATDSDRTPAMWVYLLDLLLLRHPRLALLLALPFVHATPLDSLLTPAQEFIEFYPIAMIFLLPCYAIYFYTNRCRKKKVFGWLLVFIAAALQFNPFFLFSLPLAVGIAFLFYYYDPPKLESYATWLTRCPYHSTRQADGDRPAFASRMAQSMPAPGGWMTDGLSCEAYRRLASRIKYDKSEADHSRSIRTSFMARGTRPRVSEKAV
jgi:hypothetical protein